MSDATRSWCDCRSRAALAKRVGLPQPVDARPSPRASEVAAACCSAAPGGVAEAAARVLAELGRRLGDGAGRPGARARRGRRARRRRVQPRGAGRPALQGARVRRHRDRRARPTSSSCSVSSIPRPRRPRPRVVLGMPGAVIVLERRPRGRSRASRARSAKEVGRGATVQPRPRRARAPRSRSAPTLRFLLSPRSAYVSGQVVHVGPAAPGDDWSARSPAAPRWSPAPRAGSARRSPRCSSARARVVVRLDLHRTPTSSSTSPPPTRPRAIAERFADGLDILVHNAGVTKDRTLAKMPEDRWQSLMEVNLLAPERITAALLPGSATTGGSSACPR